MYKESMSCRNRCFVTYNLWYILILMIFLWKILFVTQNSCRMKPLTGIIRMSSLCVPMWCHLTSISQLSHLTWSSLAGYCFTSLMKRWKTYALLNFTYLRLDIYIYIYIVKGVSLLLQVKALAQRMLKWLKVGGHFFFRESCFRHSGDHERKNNPSYYRHPEFYNEVSLSSFSFSSYSLFEDCTFTYVLMRVETLKQ